MENKACTKNVQKRNGPSAVWDSLVQNRYIPVNLPALFNFDHPYYKLERPVFHTVRSKGYSKKHNIKIGRIGWITLLRSRFKKVRVVGQRDIQIRKMSLGFLKQDAEYDGFVIHNHQDYVDFLDSFCKFPSLLTTIKRVFILEEVQRVC